MTRGLFTTTASSGRQEDIASSDLASDMVAIRRSEVISCQGRFEKGRIMGLMVVLSETVCLLRVKLE